MPNNLSVENNFIGGLKTEFTGLNFPENACTATSNCVFSIIGDVLRREGIDFESGFTLNSINTANQAVNYYRWLNAGGDGASQILVVQVGGILHFYLTSSATTSISSQLLMGTVTLSAYLPTGSTNDPSLVECQFTDGNGYLFVFSSVLDPFYVQFVPASGGGPAIITNRITLQIRDFVGINPEPGNPAVNFRPTTLIDEHNYNLQNQGWTNAVTWTTTSTTNALSQSGNTLSITVGSHTFTVASGLTVTPGTQINITWSAGMSVQSPGDGNYPATATGTATGNVTSYSGTSMVINVTNTTGWNPSPGTIAGGPFGVSNTITSSNLINTINTWHTQVGNYPSNADIWFEFKDAGTITGENGVPTFNPSVTIAQVILSNAQAPQGHFLLNPFIQQRARASGITSLTDVITMKRPKTGTWFQGRVWYTGVDDSYIPTGDMPFSTWTENIYFSQVVSDTNDFGACFQANDPTDDRLFDLLPTDGGVIVIQGSGPIYKLFPIQNGLLVFAANGVWIIRGNSGLGFTADDYSINKVSAVQSISSTSFVDVLGLPFFWNEEGIYRVAMSQNQAPYGFGGFIVEPLTVGTILSFFNDIPFDSKRFVRGSYDPVSYVITWVYRSTQEAGISNRYKFDSALNLNIHNSAFYPYTFGVNSNISVNGVVYVNYPTGSILPSFKYLTSAGVKFTFAEERDSTNWLDWFSYDNVGVDYDSFFVTGYKVHGLGFRKFQPIYVNMFSRNTIPTAYQIQGIWDYAISPTSGRYSTAQTIYNVDTSNFGMQFRRHKIRGHGQVLQLKVNSILGKPFDIMGWAIPEQINVSA